MKTINKKEFQQSVESKDTKLSLATARVLYSDKVAGVLENKEVNYAEVLNNAMKILEHAKLEQDLALEFNKRLDKKLGLERMFATPQRNIVQLGGNNKAEMFKTPQDNITDLAA